MKTTRKLLLPILCCLFVCLGIATHTSAAIKEKNYNIQLTDNYKACTFRVIFVNSESTEGFVVTLIDPDENTYSFLQNEANSLFCVMSDVKKGNWTIRIESEQEIPATRVEVEKSNPSSSYDIGQTIKVGLDIADLKIWFEDRTVVVDWSASENESVTVKVVDLNKNAVLGSDTVDKGDHSYRCSIPSEVKTVFVSVVPTVSANIDGAARTYTLDVPSAPVTGLEMTDDVYCARDYTEAVITGSGFIGYSVDVNGKEVIAPSNPPAGVFKIPLDTEGTADIVVWIYDKDRNRFSTERHLIRDTQPPVLTMYADYDGLTVHSNTLTIEGKAFDFKELKVNEAVVETATDGYFSYDCKLHAGTSNIEVIATDAAGNRTVYSFAVETAVSGGSSSVAVTFILIVILVVIAAFFLFSKQNLRIRKAMKDKSEDIKKAAMENKESKSSESAPETEEDEYEYIERPIEVEEEVDDEDYDENFDLTRNKEKAKKTVKVQKIVREKVKKKKVTGVPETIEVKDPLITREGIRTLISIFVFIGMMYLLLAKLFLLGYCPTDSMSPKVVGGDSYFALRPMLIDTATLERGDIIVFDKDQESLMKRIIGVGGDEIYFEDGYVYINDERYDESEYLPANSETACAKTFTVPDGCYFVLGDNRIDSYDSRYWADPYISSEKISGVVKFVFSTHQLLAGN